MSDGNQLPPAGETACPTYFAKRLIQQGGAGGFACRSNGLNQWAASKVNNFPNGLGALPLSARRRLLRDWPGCGGSPASTAGKQLSPGCARKVPGSPWGQ